VVLLEETDRRRHIPDLARSVRRHDGLSEYLRMRINSDTFGHILIVTHRKQRLSPNHPHWRGIIGFSFGTIAG
jgi:hypothetical protein